MSPCLRGEFKPAFSLAEGPEVARRYVAASLPALDSRYPDLNASEVRVTYLDAGVMNYVYRVDFPGRTFFLKQALARVKQHERLGPDLGGVSPVRIQAEARALRVLQEALPVPHRGRVPAVAWYDGENNVLWTEEIAEGAVSLQATLEAGECDPHAAGELGRLLGRVHAARAGEVPPLWGTAEEDRANWLRFLRMRTVAVLERAELPPDAEAVTQELFRQAQRCERTGILSHLDAAPKNVLLSPAGEPALLDFELGAAVSDPAYDPGFLIGHYLLMGENAPEMRESAQRAAAALSGGYRETAPPVDSGWHERVARYAGLTMLYRVYGSSPAPYLAPERYAAIRKAGICLLTRQSADLPT